MGTIASVSEFQRSQTCKLCSLSFESNTQRKASSPYIASDPNVDHLLQQNISRASTRCVRSYLAPMWPSRRTDITRSSPPDVIDWDEIDPVTGLSKEYMTAIDIIDSCDYAELCRFNAPLLANQTMSVRQQIDIYYNGGESEEHRRKRKERMTGERKSVSEKVVAIATFWRCQSQRE